MHAGRSGARAAARARVEVAVGLVLAAAHALLHVDHRDLVERGDRAERRAAPLALRLAPPVRLDGDGFQAGFPIAPFGSETEAILDETGIDEAERADLIGKGVTHTGRD